MARRSAALAKIEKFQERARRVGVRTRQKAKEQAKEQQGLVVAGGSGFGIGFAERQGFALPTIDKFDPIALYAGLSFVGALFIKDRTIKDILKSTTIGLTSVALYKAGRGGFDSLFNYVPPVPTPPATAGDNTSGFGEEIVELGEF